MIGGIFITAGLHSMLHGFLEILRQQRGIPAAIGPGLGWKSVSTVERKVGLAVVVRSNVRMRRSGAAA